MSRSTNLMTDTFSLDCMSQPGEYKKGSMSKEETDTNTDRQSCLSHRAKQVKNEKPITCSGVLPQQREKSAHTVRCYIMQKD